MIQLEIFRRVMLKGSGVQPRVIAPTKVPSVYTHKYTYANTLFCFSNSRTLFEVLLSDVTVNYSDNLKVLRQKLYVTEFSRIVVWHLKAVTTVNSLQDTLTTSM